MQFQKKIKFILGLLIVCFVFLIAYLYVENQKETPFESKSENKEHTNNNIDDNSTMYLNKESVIQYNDEWFYSFMINKTNEETNHFFDGCNLKYKQLDNYGVTYIENGEIVDITPAHPTLSVSQIERNGIREGEEVRVINAYFNKAQFKEAISENEIVNWKIENFDKNLLVELFNQTISKKYSDKVGPYKMETCSIQIDRLNNDYRWNIGVMSILGNIKAVRLDIKYSDGTYLSDKIKNHTATDEQVKLYESFDEIEEYMVKEQKINIKEKFPQYKGEYYDRLQVIVDTFDDGWD